MRAGPHWRNEFAEVISSPPEMRKQVNEKCSVSVGLMVRIIIPAEKLQYSASRQQLLLVELFV